MERTRPSRERTRTGPAQARVRTLRLGDLDVVVAEHLVQFPDGFFARLGHGFLTQYYLAYAGSDSAVTLAADLNGEVVGYLVGATDPARQRSTMLRRHRRRLVAHGGLALLCRPGLLLAFGRTRAGRYARALLRRRGTPAGGPRRGGGRCAVISHVAVRREHQGQGAGSALLDAFMTVARSAGCERVALVTVAGAAGAGSFYRGAGWVEIGDHRDRDGRRLTTYELTLGHAG